MQTAEKLRTVAGVIAHAALAVVSVFCLGFTVHLFRPIVGPISYAHFARSVTADILLFIVVSATGALYFRLWRDRRALFAWVLPGAFWLFYHFAPLPIFDRDLKTILSLVVLGITLAYSMGAGLTALILQRTGRNDFR